MMRRTEHEFPLDADPVLRKYVKMEIERESAEIKLGEMKARFIRITWQTLLAFLKEEEALKEQQPGPGLYP